MLNVYSKFPIFAQNLSISLKGWQLKRQRFGGEFLTQLEECKTRIAWTEDRLKQFQLEEFNRLFAHARGHSPYYSEKFNFLPGQISTLDELRGIPVLEKETLRANLEGIRSRAYRKDGLIKVNTSGTTGAPMSLGFTKSDIRKRHALVYRFLDWYGIRPGDRSARFSGKPIFNSTKMDTVFWRVNRPGNQILFSSYHLHKKNESRYAEALVNFQPDLLDGYPSMLVFVARAILNNGMKGDLRPKLVVTTAEQLTGPSRQILEDAFDCPIANFYASSEGAPMITECPNGELVTNSDSGIFEYVRPGTNSPAHFGEISEMLVTSFTSHAYPLIRYRIGDSVLLPPRKMLSTGVTGMPVIAEVFGRKDDTLWTRHRGEVVALNRIFVNVPNTVVESQLVQADPNEVLFRFVPDRDAGFHISQLNPLNDELRARLGPINIRFEAVDVLQRSANGKLRSVIRSFDIPNFPNQTPDDL